MGYILYGGKAITGEESKDASIVINDGRILKILSSGIPLEKLVSEYPGYEVLRLEGKSVFAGGIDAHVHFREPGMTHKADIGSESAAAVAGGVTSFIDMPNTVPATTSARSLKEKLESASGRSFANYGFHLGAANDNLQEIMEILEKGKDGITAHDFGGIKVFMGSSTGNMLVDDDSVLDSLFGIRDKEILVHCEDEKIIRENIRAAESRYGDDIPFSAHSDIRSREACIKSSAKALETAVRHGTRLHLLHISTIEELEMVREAREKDCPVTAETSANYLWFSDKDYGRLGSRIKCNPSIKTEKDRQALRKALKDGLIDTIGSDHAPHLLQEKERKYLTAPSGMPSIQQSLQVLLTVAAQENIPLTRIASVFSENAASLFGIRDRGFLKEGYCADLAVVDMNAEGPVRREDLMYKCGWSPYEGEVLKGRITDVFVNGVCLVRDGRVCSGKPAGEKLVFG